MVLEIANEPMNDADSSSILDVTIYTIPNINKLTAGNYICKFSAEDYNTAMLDVCGVNNGMYPFSEEEVQIYFSTVTQTTYILVQNRINEYINRIWRYLLFKNILSCGYSIENDDYFYKHHNNLSEIYRASFCSGEKFIDIPWIPIRDISVSVSNLSDYSEYKQIDTDDGHSIIKNEYKQNIHISFFPYGTTEDASGTVFYYISPLDRDTIETIPDILLSKYIHSIELYNYIGSGPSSSDIAKMNEYFVRYYNYDSSRKPLAINHILYGDGKDTVNSIYIEEVNLLDSPTKSISVQPSKILIDDLMCIYIPGNYMIYAIELPSEKKMIIFGLFLLMMVILYMHLQIHIISEFLLNTKMVYIPNILVITR